MRHQLLFCSPFRISHAVCLVASFDACESVEFTSPAPTVPGIVGGPAPAFGDLVFPKQDHTHSGRPVRMVCHLPKSSPPVVWEFGGYRVS